MHPVLTTIELFGVARPIGAYGLMLSLSLLTFATLLLRAAIRAGQDPGLLMAVLAPAVLAAAVGAHLLSATVALLAGSPLLVALGTPALTFYGGAAGLVVALILGARAVGLPPAWLLDACVVPGALAHALGRVGCLLGGCCYGAPATGPLAIAYHHPLAPAADGLLRHPVQLYEALALVGLALVFARVRSDRPDRADRPGRPEQEALEAGAGGSRAWVRPARYVAAYAVVRLCLELLRGDPERGVWLSGGVSTSQWISAALLLAVAPVAFPRAPSLWVRSALR